MSGSVRQRSTAAGATSSAGPSQGATRIRQRPAMAKPAGSIPPSTPPRERMRSVTGGAAKRALPPAQGLETNIQVVVRCRGLSQKELNEDPSLILSTTGARGKEVFIRTNSAGTIIPPSEPASVQSLSSASSVPPPSSAMSRTYAFDRVFGPEADQSLIYQDVVSPMLDEVLSGYNCTIFAYGQTGTGKTFTMEGDLTPRLGTHSPNAGIIPRTLYRLFHKLEVSGVDYSVRVSYVELYNEELRDLLAPEASMSPPSSSAGRDGSSGGLKIFEDGSKKGVVIQGLEEVPVKDASGGLAVLCRGSQKRQMAATKMNEYSSRSHSVFSITVHTKETSSKGEDLLKVGKLNLVDLAGSENIGRSGAENKRAREAGMINQSLLTLGRVINALVERSQHVPYRESKLTRLLQDSLGGRTKTCIIATISPSRVNLEETLSTLDYALRAKTIRNRPEVNQRMTRGALIKEYVAEIDRLKSDLLAAREKNGIYLSTESWKELTDEHEARRVQTEELKRKTEVIEVQHMSLKEQFEASMLLMQRQEGELKDISRELEGKREDLERTLKEVNNYRLGLEEEVAVRKSFEMNESRLDKVAQMLKSVANESTKDVGGLFAKLERLAGVDAANREAVQECQRTLSGIASQLNKQLEDFERSHLTFTQSLRSSLGGFSRRQAEQLDAKRTSLDAHLEELSVATNALREGHSLSAAEVTTFAATIEASCKGLQGLVREQAHGMREACEGVVNSTIQDHESEVERLRQQIGSLGHLSSSMLEATHRYMNGESERIEEARIMVRASANREIEVLRAQNARLSALLAAERTKDTAMRDKVVNAVSSLLAEIIDEREHERGDAIDELQRHNQSAEQGLEMLSERHGHVMSNIASSGKAFSEEMSAQAQSAVHNADETGNDLARSLLNMKDKLETYKSNLSSTVDADMHNVADTLQTVRTAGLEARQRAESSRSERDMQLDSLTGGVRSTYEVLKQNLASTQADIEASTSGVLGSTSSFRESGSTFLRSSTATLTQFGTEMRTYLQKRMREDEPTGETPQKRVWNYRDTWSLTRPRAEIVAEVRRRRREAGEPSVSASLSDADLSFEALGTEADHGAGSNSTLVTDAAADENGDTQPQEHRQHGEVATSEPSRRSSSQSNASIATAATMEALPPPVTVPEPPKILREKPVNVQRVPSGDVLSVAVKGATFAAKQKRVKRVKH